MPLAPSPRARWGKGDFFCGVLQAGYARLQNPLIFSPLPNGACAVGEGAGGGAKATAHKGSSIAVELPDARLNYDRTFSSLDDVRQHMESPSKIEISESAVSESAKKRKGESVNFRITCLVKDARTSVRSGVASFMLA